MTNVRAIKVEQTKRELLDAAREVLTKEGFSGLSTRRVAEVADTQMSQIRYHFGSKEGMILGLFEYMNAGLIKRQAATFENPELNFSEKWALACDYLDQDLASGYVRVLQELIAAGWSNAAIGDAVRNALEQWRELITDLVREFEENQGSFGPLSSDDIAALISSTFIGVEAVILLGDDERSHQMGQALRKFGDVIALSEKHFQKE